MPNDLRIGKPAYSFLYRLAPSIPFISIKNWVPSLLFIALGSYIIAPSIYSWIESEENYKKRQARMFATKRIDKHATGLINPRNDCFANSTLQALSSCSGLIIYLNVFNTLHKTFFEFYNTHKIDMSQHQEFKNFRNMIPLHHELSLYIFKLNSPVVYTTSISVKPFLRVIETIFRSRISPNQQDAHELLQTVIETLESEYLNLIKAISLYKEQLVGKLEDKAFENEKEQVGSFLKDLIIPSFPFEGYGISQLTCLKCLRKSTLTKITFSVTSLPVPQKHEVSLSEMMQENHTETIDDYSCLICKTSEILRIEKSKENPSQELMEQLKNIVEFCKINDDIEDKELQKYIEDYEFESNIVKSKILKNFYLIKSPPIMIFHLSRSIFEHNQSTKNRCRVNFGRKVDLSINKKIYKEYKMQENVTSVDDESSDEEDEASNSDSDANEVLSSSVASDVSENDVEKDSKDSKDSKEIYQTAKELIDTIRNINLGDDLDGSIRKQEFKLKAMVRHMGNHYSGHYECYKKKPIYYEKMKKIYTRNPVIDLETLAINHDSNSDREGQLEELKEQYQASISRVSFENYKKDPVNFVEVPAIDIHGKELNPTEDALEEDVSDNGSEAHDPDISDFHFTNDMDYSKGRTRSRTMSLSFRRGLQKINLSRGGSNTSLSSLGSYIPASPAVSGSEFNDTSSNESSVISPRRSSRLSSPSMETKLPSVVKKPFWKMSDTEVKEVSEFTVYHDNMAVYMLFYEKMAN